MIFFLHAVYACLGLAVLPLVIIGELFQSQRDRPGGIRLLQRFALQVPQRMTTRPIWIHAVSTGEVTACAPLIQQLRLQGRAVCLSTGTPAGHAAARRHLPGVTVFYAPLDCWFMVRRVMEAVDPAALLLCEVELWPSLIWAAVRRRVPLFLVSGRLSPRDYRRYRAFRWFFRPFLARFSGLYMQSDADTRRMRALCPRGPVKTLGSLKWDMRPEPPGRDLEAVLPPGTVLCAASTHPEEEEMLLTAFTRLRRKRPEVRLIIAPRHPRRTPQITALLRSHGLAATLRSQAEPCRTPVLVLDSLGELGSAYARCDLVVLGGTFSPRIGGHNPIEPAAWGCPILCGGYMENARTDFERLLSAGAVKVTRPETLVQDLAALIEDPKVRRRLGRAARQVVVQNRGTAERILREIRPSLAACNASSALGPAWQHGSGHFAARALREAGFLLEAVVVLPVGRLVTCLPFKPGRRWARGLGRLLHALGRRQRARARRNLEIVTSAQPMRSAEKDALVRRVFENLAVVFFEYLKLGALSARNHASFVDMGNTDVLDSALAQGKGVLAVSAHLGNWEYLASVGAKTGRNIAAIIHRQRNPYTDRWLRNIREQRGSVRCFYDELEGLPKALRHLRANGVLAILADQRATFQPLRVPFFGQPSNTAAGPAKLHLRYGAPLVLCFALRQADDRYRFCFDGPYRFEPTETLPRDCERIMAFVNRKFEGLIRGHPDQWLGLLEERWPREPLRRPAT